MPATIVTTLFSDGTARETTEEASFRPDRDDREKDLINLYPEVAYQQIDAFGGAITEAVGVTLRKMKPELARKVVDAYFGKDGIGYKIIRTHLDSCDFSLRNYSAVEKPDDPDFSTFSLAHDEENIIPFIRMAYRAAGEDLPVMLSPWSPPAFMKTNRSRNGGGKLRRDCYSAWADYLCRYIREYRARGINVKLLSVQNEPNATQTWDSCRYSAGEERDFIRNALAPALSRAGLGDIELYIWDHNKERVFERAREVITPETDSAVRGVAFHWYSGDHFEALRMVRERFPDKKLLFSEGCIEYNRSGRDAQLKNAQMYAHDMIGNLNAGMNTFVDWNIVLDENGGPNHAGNFCDAPMIFRTAEQRLDVNLSFRYIRHFSGYIRPGARRIGFSRYTDRLEVTAFQNPDRTVAVVLLNRSNGDLPAVLRLDGRLLELSAARDSISTVLIR